MVANEMGAPHRIVGLVTAAVCGVVLFTGMSALSYLPKPLLGGFVLFFGLMLLFEWVYEGWFKLPKLDYAVVLLCLLVSANFGYLQGIGLGFIAGVLIFVIDYSRVSVIKNVFSGTNLRSNVVRGREQSNLIKEQGDKICTLRLQGFIFFGTVHNIVRFLQERLHDHDRTRLSFFVLDFRAVSNVDTSAIASFKKMKQLTERYGFRMLLADISADLEHQLRLGGVIVSGRNNVQVFVDADRALEWCEDQLMTEAQVRVENVPLEQILRRALPAPEMVARLMAYFQPTVMEQGDCLVQQGEPSTDMYFIESGRVAVQLSIPGQEPVRLRSMGSGTVVGEVAFYLDLPRSASVIAEEPTKAYRLTRSSLKIMATQDPELSAKLHELIAQLLAGRLAETTRFLSVALN